MFKPAFIFLMMLMLSGPVFSSPKKPLVKLPSPIHFVTDSSKIYLRHFDSTAMAKYRDDPAFNYTADKQANTWWDRFWQWVWDVWTGFWNWIGRLLARLFGHVHLGRSAFSAMKVVLLLLAVTLIVFIISRLAGIDLLRSIRKNQPVDQVPYSESLENIHQINFDEAIENALTVKDYRLAVRLLYLRSLKQLSDANLINWRIEKTNSAYLNELTDVEQRRRFSIVTRQFEYVWYGDFPVDGQSFNSINSFFQEFKQALS